MRTPGTASRRTATRTWGCARACLLAAGLLLLAGCTLYARFREYAPGGDVLAPQAVPVTREDVVRLTRASIPDDVILERLAADGLSRPILPRDIPELRIAGVSDRVIAAMGAARLVPSSQALEPSRSDRRYLYWRPGLGLHDDDPSIWQEDPLHHKDRW